MNWNDHIIKTGIMLSVSTVKRIIEGSLSQEEIVEFMQELLWSLDERAQQNFKDWFDDWWGE